ncbi:MAG: proton-conducting transporter membrane subunit, partial [Pirellulales bacterium]
MTVDMLFTGLGICVVAMPSLLLLVFGLTSLVNRPLSEQALARFTQTAVITGLCAAVAILLLMLGTGVRFVPIELGHWVVIPQEHFHFHLKFVFDRLSVPFCILTFVLVGTTGAFANRYLHREPGYLRFFVFYAVFLLGMVVAALAGTIETLFLGWELVGLSSALLVAYFHERRSPVVNGQRVWSVYRVSDAAFLIAAVVLHHLSGAGDFAGLMGTGPWPEGEAALTSGQALIVGSLLLVAAAGKSALVPFSGWLPRAMEGPTPSSAIFYGALSVHLGVYLLLRVSPILELSMTLCVAVVALGLISAMFGALAASVQTDIKSALAFASLTQVGIITAEIGLG